ncbi:MAG: phytanoyl-CoA dioxygenase family protein [Candidatus Latescibacterota bacterium]|uniref:Phytanoyl-CoA dioxygenase n=1 Tax=marine metagenome TaxID=408172 RepID=A0A382H5U7_9ZZZZ|nr:phytanoyl-CoA dioxygenase family protein [Candidatus Latescibacterota bacterium]MEE3335548.1 phytanoyl-CoA dioxygenase family protein [Candidatus Latescibacterota bacterium]|tara:strand:+ start:522 stop:1286 length:765 start_codon:yes stop_codon:yes gene_type:complete
MTNRSAIDVRQIVRSLQTDGVTLVENQLTDDQCQQALDGIEWGLQNKAGPQPLQRQRTYEWFREFPIFVELIENPLVIQIADACLGQEYHLICAEITRNEKDNHYLEAVKKTHQDHCFFPKQSDLLTQMQTRMFGFTAQWVVLDIPPEMGPTEFIPGSQRSGQRHTNEIAPSDFSFRSHFPRGSLVLYDHRVWHRGTDNHSETARDLPQNCYALHAVDKVQIMTTCEDGAEIYVPCSELLESGSDTIRKLLSPV